MADKPIPPAKATTKPPDPDPVHTALAPEPEPVGDVPAMPVIPEAPALPTVFTPVTVATYIGSLLVFLVGMLVLFGVPIPAHVSAMVQTVAGTIASSVGALVPVIALISHHSVQRTALNAGVPLNQVVSIRG